MPLPTRPALRSDLGLLPRYVAGAAGGDAGGFKLSSNELAEPVLPEVVAAAAAAAATANRYPDVVGAPLVARLAEELQVAPGRIVVGGGSIAVLQQVVQAVVDPGDPVVFAWRSYEAYPIIVRVCHGEPVPVPLRDHRHDLPALAAAVRRTGAPLVVVCNPNNPTGTTVTAAELDRFLDEVPSSCTVVLDEAYREFVDDPHSPDGLEPAAGRPNVVVLRTFSKAHGLAGLRVGYGVAPEPVADAIRAVALPFTVSAVAQAAAVAALDAWPAQRLVVADVVARRQRFADELRAAGVDTPPSQSNFVWVPEPAAARLDPEMLARDGIAVRRFPGDGVRVTIGEPEGLDQVLRAVRESQVAATGRPETRIATTVPPSA
jgi:histidinol-phosphate aminotransferase